MDLRNSEMVLIEKERYDEAIKILKNEIILKRISENLITNDLSFKYFTDKLNEKIGNELKIFNVLIEGVPSEVNVNLYYNLEYNGIYLLEVRAFNSIDGSMLNVYLESFDKDFNFIKNDIVDYDVWSYGKWEILK